MDSGHFSSSTLFVSNMSEDVWPFVSAISDPKSRAAEISENANLLSERDLLSLGGEENLIFLSPRPVSREFLDYYRELFSGNQPLILVPRRHSGQISLDAMHDPDVIQKIISRAGKKSPVLMRSYSASPQFYLLAETLMKLGVKIQICDAPPTENAQTVDFLGSKIGIRQVVDKLKNKHPSIKMAAGLICFGRKATANLAVKIYSAEKGVVIKTNRGHSGAGVLIFRHGELPEDPLTCQEKILSILSLDEYWEKFPTVVESLIQVNYKIGGGFPNGEFYIDADGKVILLYLCGMRVDRKGIFGGIEIGPRVLDQKTGAKIIALGGLLGRYYSGWGYRGYYDVDTIADFNGDLWITESNTRRTGGTFAYLIGKKLLGGDFMNHSYAISCSSYTAAQNGNLTLSKIRGRLGSAMFDRKTKSGIVITAANYLDKHQFGYIIFAKNKVEAEKIEKRLKNQ